MKKLVLCLSVLLWGTASMSQASVTTVTYQKTRQSAAMIELPYSPEVFENSIKEHFGKQGSKASDAKGFLVFKNARLESNSENPLYDLYFKIDRKSRQEKDRSIVYLTVGHPGENIAVRQSSDTYGQGDAKTFLNNVTGMTEAFSLELQIKEQQEIIQRADKKYKGMIEDSVDLQKKKFSLEEKIADNRRLQENQKAELEKQRLVLEALIGRRK